MRSCLVATLFNLHSKYFGLLKDRIENVNRGLMKLVVICSQTKCGQTIFYRNSVVHLMSSRHIILTASQHACRRPNVLPIITAPIPPHPPPVARSAVPACSFAAACRCAGQTPAVVRVAVQERREGVQVQLCQSPRGHETAPHGAGRQDGPASRAAGPFRNEPTRPSEKRLAPHFE